MNEVFSLSLGDEYFLRRYKSELLNENQGSKTPNGKKYEAKSLSVNIPEIDLLQDQKRSKSRTSVTRGREEELPSPISKRPNSFFSPLRMATINARRKRQEQNSGLMGKENEKINLSDSDILEKNEPKNNAKSKSLFFNDNKGFDYLKKTFGTKRSRSQVNHHEVTKWGKEQYSIDTDIDSDEEDDQVFASRMLYGHGKSPLSLKNDLKKSIQLGHELMEKNKELTDENSSIRSKNEHLVKTNIELNQLNEELEDKLKKFKEMSFFESLQVKKNQELEKQLNEAQLQNNRILQKNKEIRKLIQTQKEENQSVNHKKEIFEQKTRELQKKIQKGSEKLKIIAKTEKEKENENRELKRKLELYQEKMENEIRRLENRNFEILSKLKSERLENDRISNELKKSFEENEDIENRLSNKLRNLEFKNEQLELDHKKQIEALRFSSSTKINQLNSLVNDLRMQIIKLESLLEKTNFRSSPARHRNTSVEYGVQMVQTIDPSRDIDFLHSPNKQEDSIQPKPRIATPEIRKPRSKKRRKGVTKSLSQSMKYPFGVTRDEIRKKKFPKKEKEKTVRRRKRVSTGISTGMQSSRKSIATKSKTTTKSQLSKTVSASRISSMETSNANLELNKTSAPVEKKKRKKKKKKKERKIVSKEFEQARKKVLKLTRGKLNELYSYSNPPIMVKQIVRCVVLMLGRTFEDVEEWGEVRKFVKSNIVKEITAFVPDWSKMDEMTFDFIKEEIGGIKRDKIYFVSQTGLILYKWLNECIKVLNEQKLHDDF